MKKIRDIYGEEHEAELIGNSEGPYLEYEYKVRVKQYNPNFGDNRRCICGHSYYRHFDSYEDMEACGCKYCGCQEFVEAKDELHTKKIIRKCKLCGNDTGDKKFAVCDKCAAEYKF